MPVKRFLIRLAFLITILSVSALESRAESWRGIIPLKSTRADVERVFGKPPPGEIDFLATYKLNDGEFRVLYSVKKLCREVDTCRCMVPDDTVLEVAVQRKVKLKFSRLTIDRSKFDRLVNPENTNEVAYCDFDSGLIYNVLQRDDSILSVQYGPSGKDCKEVAMKH